MLNSVNYANYNLYVYDMRDIIFSHFAHFYNFHHTPATRPVTGAENQRLQTHRVRTTRAARCVWYARATNPTENYSSRCASLCASLHFTMRPSKRATAPLPYLYLYTHQPNTKTMRERRANRCGTENNRTVTSFNPRLKYIMTKWVKVRRKIRFSTNEWMKSMKNKTKKTFLMRLYLEAFIAAVSLVLASYCGVVFSLVQKLSIILDVTWTRSNGEQYDAKQC